MFNFRKKLTKNEKLDFLEYLVFQVKSDMSFEKALVRYNSNQNRKKHILRIADSLFDEDKKLKFIKRTDWKDEFVQLKETEEPQDDDLPF